MNRIEELKEKPQLVCPKCGATAKVKVLILKPGNDAEVKNVDDPSVPVDYQGGDVTLCPRCYTPFTFNESGIEEITNPFVLINGAYALQSASLVMWYRKMADKTGRKNDLMEEVGSYIISMMNFSEMMLGWYNQKKQLNKGVESFGFDLKPCGKEPCICPTTPLEQAINDGLVIITNSVGHEFFEMVKLFPKHRPWTLMDLLHHMQTFTLALMQDYRESNPAGTSSKSQASE